MTAGAMAALAEGITRPTRGPLSDRPQGAR